MTREDDWVQVAMLNDAVVVDLLIQIHRTPPPPQIIKSTSESLPLEWSVRQPRSKPLSVNNNNKKLLPLSTTSSPTTPLSWSTGLTATSFSGGGSADGLEESSRKQPPPPPPPDASRSKLQVSGGTGTTSSKSYKRPRKKKSLGELKEEENLLNKEKRHLKKELAAIRMDIEKQRVINENLKRQKVEKQAIDNQTTNRYPLLPDLNIACGEEEDL